MARLPHVGGDPGSWGEILNDFLAQSHNADGSLKTDSVGAPQLRPLSVTNAALANDTIQEAKLAGDVRAKLNTPPVVADGSVTALQIADGAVTSGKLGAASVGTTQLADGAVTTEKLYGLGEPSGIASLGTDGKVPEPQLPARLDASNLATTIDSRVGPAIDTYLTANPYPEVPDATATTTGRVRLAGDLGGTAASPTVPGLAGKAPTVHAHAISDVTGLRVELDSMTSSIAAAIPTSLVDAKGDLLVGTANDTVARVPKGADGQVLTADSTDAAGVKWATPTGGASAFELRGTGFPEGVVTATVGTYYTDTAATNGAIRWVKASGTGNTGWKVLYGDTGWRYLNSSYYPNHANSEGAIRRVNDRVMFVSTVRTIGYNQQIITFPQGYRGQGSFNVGGQAKVGSAHLLNTVHLVVSPSTTFVFDGTGFQFHGNNIGSNGSATTLNHRAEWDTNQAWPTTLPGTAV